MKVILIKDIAKVGRAYEVKDLADGYANNFVIARGLGLAATKKNLESLAKKKADRELSQQSERGRLAEALAQLAKNKLRIKSAVNDQGHLFASLHGIELAKAFRVATKIDLPKDAFIVEEPLKQLGEFVVKIKTGHLAGEFPLIIERSLS